MAQLQLQLLIKITLRMGWFAAIFLGILPLWGFSLGANAPWVTSSIGKKGDYRSPPSAFTAKPGREQPASPTPINMERPTLYYAISLTWAGYHLHHFNLEAIARFRRQFRGIPLIHLINPAYFTKANTNPRWSLAKIKSQLKPQDEVGLYLAPWKSIVTAGQVIFRNRPNFWGRGAVVGGDDHCEADCGGDVPLSVYPVVDIRRIITSSIEVMQRLGFGKLRAFGIGGWLSSPDILDIMAFRGFKYDLSQVNPHILVRRLRHFPLYSWIRGSWAHRGGNPLVTSYPYRIETRYGDVIEIGNSAAKIDYLTTREIGKVFREQIMCAKNHHPATQIFHLGFHQETALQYLPRLIASLKEIFKISRENAIILRPVRFPLPHSDICRVVNGGLHNHACRCSRASYP